MGLYQGTDEPLKKETQVQHESVILELSLKRLTEMVKRLEDRVNSILRQTDVVPMNSNKEVEQPLVPHAGMLRSWHRDLAGTTNQLEDLINRIEL